MPAIGRAALLPVDNSMLLFSPSAIRAICAMQHALARDGHGVYGPRRRMLELFLERPNLEIHATARSAMASHPRSGQRQAKTWAQLFLVCHRLDTSFSTSPHSRTNNTAFSWTHHLDPHTTQDFIASSPWVSPTSCPTPGSPVCLPELSHRGPGLTWFAVLDHWTTTHSYIVGYVHNQSLPSNSLP